MKVRNNIIRQLLIVSEEYDLDIINIYFRDINSLKDEVEIIFKNEHNNFIINYSYEKDNVHNINSIALCIKSIIDESIKEDK